jgi:1-acyl-sn-glycerol-3-phosphate acyltransferase
MVFLVGYRIRVHRLKNYPDQDGFLICANHQSFLDPMVVGVLCPRPINYLGRKSLFKVKAIRWFLELNDTIPLDQSAGLSGLKETMRRLKRKESVLIFPEGTRSPDGEMKSLKLGFCSIARRTKSPLLPFCFDGPYQAFPRSSKIPRLGKIEAVVGELIPYEDYAELSDQQMALLLESRMRECFDEARKRRAGEKVFDDEEFAAVETIG